MKNVLTEEVSALPEQHTFAEVDRLASEIKIMLSDSRAGMERARRADQEIEHQLHELERRIHCWND
jgi:outer membrane murein-binding lipoprotein Lpp